jgi:hypothetical protein
MRFWGREIAGWLLLLMGLYVFLTCYAMLANIDQPPRILEAGPLVVIGFVVFRGGIHLLKVAAAARVCLQAQAMLKGPDAGRGPAGGLRDPRAERYQGSVARQ